MPTKDWEDALGIKDDDADKEYLAHQSSTNEASFHREEIVLHASRDLNLLAGLAMPDVFTYMYPELYLTIWMLLRQLSTQGEFPQLALGIPRGFGKTTLIKLFILYCILFTKKKFILVTASTASMAENIIADVFDMLSEPNIVAIFGRWQDGAETDRNDLKKFGFRGRNIVVAALGAEGSLRGLNIKNARPDVMIFEDIQTRECADSKMQSDNLERWMIGTAMKAKSPAGCLFIFCGNMYPTEYSILKKLKENPGWIKFISGAILEDGRSLWPEHRSVDSLVKELDGDIAAGHPEIFFAEVLNDTEAGVNNQIDFSSIPQWPWMGEEQPQGKFIIIDPSSNRIKSDNVAIGYFEVYDEVPALRSVIEERLSPGNTIRQALLLALKTGTKVIVVEGVAYQHSLLYWFGEVCKTLGIEGIYCVDIYPGATSKNYRIQSTLKSITSGEIILHGSVRNRVTHQIANWNPLKRDNVDDILDLLGYAPRVVAEYMGLIPTDFNIHHIEATSTGVVEDNHAF